MNYNYTINVCLLGNSGIGKSSLCNRIDKNEFHYNLASTIGVDFLTKIFPIEYENNTFYIKWNIYDTAGQEMYNALVSNYYRNATIFLLGFDLTDNNSYKNIDYWMEQIKKFNNNYYKVYLFGNKMDLIDKIQICDSYVADVVEKYNIDYFKISVLKNIGVGKMVSLINNDIIRFLTNSNIDDSEKIQKHIKINNYDGSKLNLNPINYDNKCC